MSVLKRFLASVALLAVVVVPAAAQFPGGGFGGPFPMGPGMFPGGPGPSWRNFRGMRGRGGWGRGRSDAFRQQVQQIETALRRFDTNHDGTISPDEVSLADRARYDALVRLAGLNPAGPVSVKSLRDKLVQRAMGQSPESPPPSKSSKQSESASATASLVPGFGPPAHGAAVPGFGPPAAEKIAASSGSTSSSPSSSTTASSASAQPTSSPARPQIDDRFRKFAESLLRQYDKNKNGVLEKEEWMQMKRTWWDADTNHDGLITLDELTAKVASYSGQSRTTSVATRSGASGGPAASGSVAVPSGSGSSTSSDAPPKKSYRFLSPQERLPGGLPDWFRRKDTNGDGQVTMAEYAPGGWSEALAEEFAKYDLNGDGVITPEECLKVVNSTK